MFGWDFSSSYLDGRYLESARKSWTLAASFPAACSCLMPLNRFLSASPREVGWSLASWSQRIGIVRTSGSRCRRIPSRSSAGSPRSDARGGRAGSEAGDWDAIS